jgi:hypothetical protein
MKGMKIHKRSEGGYLSQLEKSRPELFKTINQYRTRLAGLEGGEDLQKTFDTRANIQFQATRNMAAPERDAYIADVEKQFAQATDKQFDSLVEDLKSEKRFVPTYRFAADQTSYGPTTGYYRNLQKEIDEKQKFLDDLKFTETRTRTVPQYEMTTLPPGYGLVGGRSAETKMVTELPKDARLTQGSYGRQFYQAPMKGANFYQANTNPTYRRVGSKKITEKFERQAKAGDPEYDKAFAELGRLQTRHKYRNLYSTPSKSQMTGSNIYEKLGMTGTPTQKFGMFGIPVPTPTTPFAKPIPSRGRGFGQQPIVTGTPFNQPIPSTTNPSFTMQMNKGGEIKGKGKAVRGFKFGGVK